MDMDVGPCTELEPGPEDEALVAYFERPMALVMGRGGVDPIPLRDALVIRGFNVRLCGGPSRSRCPLVTGRACGLRDDADIAVVYMEAIGASSSKRILKLMCAARQSRPAIIALEGRASAPSETGDFTLVGAMRDPAEIADLAGHLVGL